MYTLELLLEQLPVFMQQPEECNSKNVAGDTRALLNFENHICIHGHLNLGHLPEYSTCRYNTAINFLIQD